MRQETRLQQQVGCCQDRTYDSIHRDTHLKMYDEDNISNIVPILRAEVDKDFIRPLENNGEKVVITQIIIKLKTNYYTSSPF